MKAAAKRLSVLSEDESLRMLEEAREKNRRDEYARRAYALEKGMRKGIKTGIKTGRKEGIEEGREKEQTKVILNMLKKKVDITFISEITGVSVKEIKKLKKTKTT